MNIWNRACRQTIMRIEESETSRTIARQPGAKTDPDVTCCVLGKERARSPAGDGSDGESARSREKVSVARSQRASPLGAAVVEAQTSPRESSKMRKTCW